MLWLGLAGMLGTMARYGLGGLVQKSTGAEFPWGTLAVNAFGCFFAGMFWALSENHVHLGGQTRVVILIGFMGAFTTFSSFILETGELMRSAEWVRAGINIVLQNLTGVLALFLGMIAGQLL